MKKNYINLFASLVIIGFMITSNSLLENRAYNNGFEKGVTCTLDTVSKIMDKQVRSDTTITQLTMVIENKDTITYFLSPKTVKSKE